MDVNFFADSESNFRRNGQMELKYHQLIELLKYYLYTEGFFFLLHSPVMIFLNLKNDPLPFVAKYYFLYKT